MDFFAQQDIARRNTRLLVLLFLGTVLLLVLATNVLVAAFLFFSQDYNIYSGHREGVAGFLSYFSWPQFGTIGLGITTTVVLVVLAKWMQLSTGGKVVAEGMGGTRVLPQSRDPAERRCLNVVEEMALAAMLKGITFIGDVGHFLLRSTNRVRTGVSNRRGAASPCWV